MSIPSSCVFCTQINITDGRPADVLWVLLCKQVADVVYTLHENTVSVLPVHVCRSDSSRLDCLGFIG